MLLLLPVVGAATAFGSIALFSPYSTFLRRTLPHNGTLEARQVIVRDSKRRERVRLGLTASAPGDELLKFYDREHQVRAIFGVDYNGVPRLIFLDRNGKSLAALRVRGQKGTVLKFFDRAGGGRFEVP